MGDLGQKICFSVQRNVLKLLSVVIMCVAKRLRWKCWNITLRGVGVHLRTCSVWCKLGSVFYLVPVRVRVSVCV